MILNPSNVELTKVHYYETAKRHRNLEPFGREVFDNNVNRNAFIKHNIFGHRWVLKINETGDEVKARGRRRIVLYASVSCCILIAVGFGVWISLVESYLLKRERNTTENNEVPNRTITIPTTPRSEFPSTVTNIRSSGNLDQRHSSAVKSERYKIIQVKLETTINVTGNITEDNKNKVILKKSTICNCSNLRDICFKALPLRPPVCTPSKDVHDPSGCGGLCKFNVQYCKLLDKTRGIYECINNTNIIKCPAEHFNCGNMCLHRSKRCDGFKHCKDNSDEENCDCNLKTHFHCGNSTSCLSIEKKCDGRVDCWDSYDELNCNRSCVSGQVPCIKHGQCIQRNKICDGVADCLDGSDEPQGC